MNLMRYKPQWSPPQNGGSTSGQDGDKGHAERTAMEPAGARRGINGTEYQFGQGMLPQWSPSLTDGNAALRIQARLTCGDRSSREQLMRAQRADHY
jgi:hypothetical protein